MTSFLSGSPGWEPTLGIGGEEHMCLRSRRLCVVCAVCPSTVFTYPSSCQERYCNIPLPQMGITLDVLPK